ncbi:MAG: UvrD-helicase domain-containing protein, partial [Deltaproteobacteria bacterium]|nr:UvrD-helicase domain-containing protein [Deltaproteobacteria bacterium]
MNPFEPFTISLSGQKMIEASAGTGKTYSITLLYIRFLLEENCKVESILVVTFTEAAKNELVEKIRLTIRYCIEILKTGPIESEKTAEGLIPYLKSRSDPSKDLKLLNQALKHFGNSKIFTIHGFCLRTLKDYAFESAVSFQLENIKNQDILIKEILIEFISLRFRNFDPRVLHFIGDKINYNKLEILLGKALRHHQFKMVPLENGTDDPIPLDNFLIAFNNARQSWVSRKDLLLEIFRKEKIYNSNHLVLYVDAVEKLFSGVPLLDFRYFDRLGKFSLTALKTRKKWDKVPNDPFLNACETLCYEKKALEQRLDLEVIQIKKELITFALEQLAQRKEKANQIYYNDMQSLLSQALMRGGNSLIKDELRKNYRTVMIDEFQDTDPLQYNIFKSILKDSSIVSFFIGDPKQSIYTFRSADIFVYIQAKRETGLPFQMATNWRSDPDLIRVINFLFTLKGNQNPFLFKDIPYSPVGHPDGKKNHFVCALNQNAPVEVSFLSSKLFLKEKEINKINKPQITDKITELLSTQIISLMNSGTYLLKDDQQAKLS